MSVKKHITPEVMKKVWTLHRHGISKADIISITEISSASVDRIVGIMKATYLEDDVTLEHSYRECENLKRYARQILGMTERKPEPKPEPVEEKQPIPDNTAQAMKNVLDELYRQTELLERLCAVWDA